MIELAFALGTIGIIILFFVNKRIKELEQRKRNSRKGYRDCYLDALATTERIKKITSITSTIDKKIVASQPAVDETLIATNANGVVTAAKTMPSTTKSQKSTRIFQISLKSIKRIIHHINLNGTVPYFAPYFGFSCSMV